MKMKLYISHILSTLAKTLCIVIQRFIFFHTLPVKIFNCTKKGIKKPHLIGRARILRQYERGKHATNCHILYPLGIDRTKITIIRQSIAQYLIPSYRSNFSSLTSKV